MPPVEDFERNVIDRLARIETWSRANYRALLEHTQQDEDRFTKIEEKLGDVVTDHKVAKRTGRLWGSAAAAVLLAVAEAARAWLAG